jgi:hypothetical protein
LQASGSIGSTGEQLKFKPYKTKAGCPVHCPVSLHTRPLATTQLS